MYWVSTLQMNVLTISRSYINSVRIRDLFDAQGTDFQWFFELNAIAGIEKVHEIRPQILVLFLDLGWIGVVDFLTQAAPALDSSVILVVTPNAIDEWQMQQLFTDLLAVRSDLQSRVIVERLEDIGSDLIEQVMDKAASLAVSGATEPADQSHKLALAEPAFVRSQLEAIYKSLLKANLNDLVLAAWVSSAANSISLEVPGKVLKRCLAPKAFFSTDPHTIFAAVDLHTLPDYEHKVFLAFENTFFQESSDLQAQLRLFYTNPINLSAFFDSVEDIKREAAQLFFYSSHKPILLQAEAAGSFQAGVWTQLFRQMFQSLLWRDCTNLCRQVQTLFLELVRAERSWVLLGLAERITLDILQAAYAIGMAGQKMQPVTTSSFKDLDAQTEFYCEKLRQCFELEQIHSSKTGDTISKVIDILFSEYSADQNLLNLSSRVALAPAYLSRAFRKTTGIGLNYLLQAIRLDHSVLLARAGIQHVEKLAERVGFSDPKYFSTKFRERFDYPPSAMIREIQAEQKGRK